MLDDHDITDGEWREYVGYSFSPGKAILVRHTNVGFMPDVMRGRLIRWRSVLLLLLLLLLLNDKGFLSCSRMLSAFVTNASSPLYPKDSDTALVNEHNFSHGLNGGHHTGTFTERNVHDVFRPIIHHASGEHGSCQHEFVHVEYMGIRRRRRR